MHDERSGLEAAIGALQAQRALLGDAVVDAALAPMRARLAALACEDGGNGDSGDNVREPAQALRLVSILFLDVVGSTLLSRELDPEEIHAVMDGALARAAAVVEAHQGKVLQFAGDNLLAAFGATQAREDDAARAVRCGLALLALGRTLAAQVLARHGHAGFDLRVGIHTGPVLLGGGVDAEGTIRGIAVNIAARMEQTAPAGALRISHDTQVQVRGLFELEAQPGLQVKGLDEPMQSYLVRGVRPRGLRSGARGIDGLATPMVGRVAEMAALQQAFARLCDGSHAHQPRLLLLVAEAGIGKSRLLAEFGDWVDARSPPVQRLHGRATPATPGQPYGLLRDILARYAQIADDDPLAAARAKLEQSVMPMFVGEEGALAAEGHVHRLGHLLGLDFGHSPHVRAIADDPRQLRSLAFRTLVQLWRTMWASTDRPLVLELEDLHWSDDESLDFLGELLASGADLPMLVLGSSRPTLFERAGDWRRPVEHWPRIELLPLDRSDSRTLADGLLCRLAQVPDTLRELLVADAEGNPFYMEELVRMLIDRGALLPGREPSGTWSLDAQKLQPGAVPPTLVGVLQARLDSLPAAEKAALQRASVIGFLFWDRALAAIDAAAHGCLPGLVKRALVLPRADAALRADQEVQEYAFKHQILHRVTYDTVLKRTRRELHGRLARWYAAQAGRLAGDLLGLAAEHHERGGDRVQALRLFRRAAEAAAERYAHATAQAHARRALALVGADDAQDHWAVLDVLERVADLRGEREAQRHCLHQMQQLAERLGGVEIRAALAFRRSLFAGRIGDFAANIDLARECVALAEPAGLWEQVARACCEWGGSLMCLGDFDAARARTRDGLAAARRAGAGKAQAQLMTLLGSIEVTAGRGPIGITHLGEALQLARAGGHRRLEGVVLGNLADAQSRLGDFAAALPHFRASLEIARAIGNRVGEAVAMTSLGTLRLCLGDDEAALVDNREAVRLGRAAGDALVEANALLNLSDASLALGQAGDAETAAAAALAVFERIGVPHGVLQARARLAELELDGGRLPAALVQVQAIRGAVDGGVALEAAEDPQRIEFACHRVLAAAGDARAADCLARAAAHLSRLAAPMADGARQRFLHELPRNRRIVDATARASAAPPAAVAG